MLGDTVVTFIGVTVMMIKRPTMFQFRQFHCLKLRQQYRFPNFKSALPQNQTSFHVFQPLQVSAAEKCQKTKIVLD